MITFVTENTNSMEGSCNITFLVVALVAVLILQICCLVLLKVAKDANKIAQMALDAWKSATDENRRLIDRHFELVEENIRLRYERNQSAD